MKKLLVFFSFFLISTSVYAVDFLPNKKVITLVDNSGENKSLFEFKSLAINCSPESADINQWSYCIAINGEIKKPTKDYQGCIDALGDDSICNYSAGSSIKFEDKLEPLLIQYLEEFIFERYRKLLLDTSSLVSNYEMKRLPPLKVFLNSPGGSVDEALEIGKLIRKYQLATNVAQGDECLSSCFLLFMSGVSRSMSDNFYRNMDLRVGHQVSVEHVPVGIHRMFYESKDFSELSADEASVMYREKYREIESYLKNVGTPNYFIDKMNNTPSDKMFILTESELAKAVVDKNLNINDLYNDQVFYDRLKGSDMEWGDFIFQEQVRAIYPDYINNLRFYFKNYDSMLRKVYGQEYWKKPLFIGDEDLSALSEEDCIFNSFDESHFVLDYCKKYLEDD